MSNVGTEFPFGSAPTVGTSRRRRWFVSARADVLLFLGLPFLLFVMIELARRQSWEVAIVLAGSVGAVGHHAPGLIRAYGDRALFSRHWPRLVFGPLLLAILCVVFVFGEIEGLGFIVLMWGVWHAMAQVYGMGRAYDAKHGHLSRRTARIDKVFCLSWFALVLVHSESRLRVALTELYKSGLPAISPDLISGLQLASIIATSAVTGAWILHIIDSNDTDRPQSATKVALFVGSIAFWWYAHVPVANVILGVVIFEILHDIHYLGFVWTFKHSDLRRTELPSRASRAFFASRPASVLLFALVAVAYGVAFRGAEFAFSGTPLRVVSVLILVSTLVHFYTDSFIWNLRDAPVRRVLGVEQSEET